jgi:hypothetical protein
VRVCLMIEGQEDITWDQWVALARACEEHGLEGLFRSDHYVSVMGRPERGSLDAWTTLAGLAAVTDRIRLGTMVSPATFRHPSVLAKSVVTVDHISGGRVELGMGAGWHTVEHRAYGFEYADDDTRMSVLEEQVEIVHEQWSQDGFTFDGAHYRLDDVRALPKPLQRPHPPLIIGGRAGPGREQPPGTGQRAVGIVLYRLRVDGGRAGHRDREDPLLPKRQGHRGSVLRTRLRRDRRSRRLPQRNVQPAGQRSRGPLCLCDSLFPR